MSLTLSQLRSRVVQSYPDVQQITETVLRYTRSEKQSPFAVYYLDIAQDLPSTQKELTNYLERVVGTHYFEGRSSLQWNNYLYFIKEAKTLTDSATRNAKELVERDRTYARKFVIAETELDSVLKPGIAQPTKYTKKVDVISDWTAVLKQSNLVDAVFGDYSIPQRMELIDGTRKPLESSRQTSSSIQPDALLPALRQLIIKQFRTYPKQRGFDFGEVNLLFGANGTGKTSLLEAIELYYCGKTKRNPKTEEEYKFVVVLGGGKPETVANTRPLQEFRDRNLRWYGIHEERSTKLYDGFGRFNFLDTDAALTLTQSTSSIEDELAKLLVGSEASKTWRVIEKLSDKVEPALRAAENLLKQVVQELNLLNEQLEDASTVKKESDSLQNALRESLHRNEWRIDEHDLEAEAGELVEQLTGLTAVARQATSLSWLDSPLTLDDCDRYCQSLDKIVKACTPTVTKLESLRVSQRKLTEATRKSRLALNLVDELARLVASGIEGRAAELAKLRDVITANSDLVVGIEDAALRKCCEANGSLVVSAYRVSSIATREQAEKSLTLAKREHQDFAKLRDRSLTLAQELRQVAAHILEDNPSDECPLCHTKFQQGELTRHMAAGVDEYLEVMGQKLLGNVRRLETELGVAVETEKAANQIATFCISAGLPVTTDLKDTLVKLKDVQDDLQEARKRSEVLTSEIVSLESQGLSQKRLDEICEELSKLGYRVAERSREAIRSLRNGIEEAAQSSSRDLQENAQEEARLKQTFESAVQSLRLTESDPQRALAELREQLATTQKVQSRIRLFLPRFTWPPSGPIGEWVVEAEAVRGIAAQLQTALGAERIASHTRSAAAKRKDDLQEEQKELTERIERLNVADSALDEIITNHSLEAVTQFALQENRRSIETIFSQIHSPAEFKGIGKNWTLVRKCDGGDTDLTKISTGQRSAFALSLFLAQNAQLNAGPRVILIDDPIAHVDDLNALSFLDYLREIALTRTRQIFFATASDKLASLFERKFEFLGKERFRRYNLRDCA